MAKKKFIVAWLPAAIWMLVIFVFSGRESTRITSDYWGNFLFFKTLHVIEYGVLFLLNVRALKQARLAFLLTILYAATDEIHQLFVPTREGRVRDVIIDGLGAILAWIFLTTLLPKAPKKLRTLARSWGLSS